MNKRLDTQKLSLHPAEVSAWLNNGIVPPIYIEISISDFCNHKCLFCAFDYYNKPSMIDPFVMNRFLSESANMGIRSCMCAGVGEPFLHPRLIDIIASTSDRIDFALATNGVLATRDCLARILPHLKGLRFSIDSGSPESHKAIHKGKRNDYWQILKNVNDACKIKADLACDVDLMVQFLCLSENIDTLPQFIETYLNTDIDAISIKPYSKHPLSINNLSENYDTEFVQQLNDIVSQYNDRRLLVRSSSFERAVDSNEHNLCYALSFWGYIDGQGSVWSCGNFVGNEDYLCGNINCDSTAEIWLGSKRKAIIDRGKTIPTDCRANCRMQSCNDYLSELLIQRQNKWYNFI